MNSYEQKLEARRQRYEQRAEKADAESRRRIEASEAATAGIPLGQPILVGHHSEARHRAALKRSWQNADKAVEESRKAEYYRNKAESVGLGGISSDDPEAAEKIRAQIEELRADHDAMKRWNAQYRKGGADAIDDPKAADEARHLEQIWKGRIPGSGPFGSNLAEISRLEDRLAGLERLERQRAENPEGSKTTHQGDGFKVVENYEANRLQIIFDGKPPADVRAICKKCGFRWAPSQCAWQRHLNNAARFNASMAVEQISGQKMEQPTTPAEPEAPAEPVILRQFSPCGPCLTVGRLTRETAQFYFYNEWEGGDRYSNAEKRISKRRVHIEPCHSCRDHERTMYPHGYMD